MTKSNSNKKDAIIFIQGMGNDKTYQNLDVIARKFCGAFERQSEISAKSFRVVGASEEKYGNIYRTPVCTLIENSGDNEEKPIADLFELDYRENLTKSFVAASPIIKVLIMISTLFVLLPRFFLSFVKKGKNFTEMLQMLVVGSLICLIAIYSMVLLTALIGTLTPESLTGTNLPDGIKTFLSSIGLNEEDGTGFTKSWDMIVGILQSIVVFFAGLGLFTRKNAKEFISNLATTYVSATNYIRLATSKQEIMGQLTALLDHLGEKEEQYAAIHIVAFSFGSLVALDTIYPHSRPAARLKPIKSIVTIGCPFDLIRSYWPEYFTKRQALEDCKPSWVNIYAPLDFFGSNFRDDNLPQEADHGIKLSADNMDNPIKPGKNISYEIGIQGTSITLLDVIVIKGIKIHSQYWSETENPQHSCFDDITAELYGDL